MYNTPTCTTVPLLTLGHFGVARSHATVIDQVSVVMVNIFFIVFLVMRRWSLVSTWERLFVLPSKISSVVELSLEDSHLPNLIHLRHLEQNIYLSLKEGMLCPILHDSSFAWYRGQQSVCPPPSPSYTLSRTKSFKRKLPYSSKFSWHNIFVNFVIWLLITKIFLTKI